MTRGCQCSSLESFRYYQEKIVTKVAATKSLSSEKQEIEKDTNYAQVKTLICMTAEELIITVKTGNKIASFPVVL